MEKLNLAPARLRYSIANICPCGKSNKDGKFSPDKENPECGYCHSCGNSFFPNSEKPFVIPKAAEIKQTDFIDQKLMTKSLAGYDKNNFIQFVKKLYPQSEVEAKAKNYGIGTSKLWKGANIYFQIDGENQVRSGKIMLYDVETGKRVKEPTNHFNWLHSVLKLKDFNLSQCLFGLHLVNQTEKPIAIVESEKTAFLMSLENETYHWLATGGKSNFSYETLAPIKDKKIVAFPDKGEFQYWFDISERLKDFGFDITVSNVIENENYTTGTDLADLLIEEKKTTAITADFEPIEQTVPTTETFDLRALKRLAELIIPERYCRSKNEIINAIKQLENVTDKDAENIVDMMRLSDVIDKTSHGDYFLFNSTPF